MRRSALAFVVALVLVACSDDSPDRQAAVAERGEHVMPFDLDATTHRFDSVPTGLVETVLADDPSDADQVRLIREHLRHEGDRFRTGDYGDPAAIHGDDMPGLAELEAGAADVAVTFEDVDAGARLTFATADPTLVDALHRWGRAQTTDHHTGSQRPES